MKEHYCKYCGKNTYDVDVEYLIGWNHLACVLSDMPELKDWASSNTKKKKPMEIKNWTKLNGQKFDVMGASFVIMDTSVDSLSDCNVYTAWIHPWNDSEALVRVLLFTDDMHLQIKVLPPKDYDSIIIPIELTTTITKTHLSNPSIFVQTIAKGLLDDPTTRDIISFVGRKQDNTTRFKGRGYTQLTGTNGSSGNNLW
jgi:hypothetical protein